MHACMHLPWTSTTLYDIGAIIIMMKWYVPCPWVRVWKRKILETHDGLKNKRTLVSVFPTMDARKQTNAWLFVRHQTTDCMVRHLMMHSHDGVACHERECVMLDARSYVRTCTQQKAASCRYRERTSTQKSQLDISILKA